MLDPEYSRGSAGTEAVITARFAELSIRATPLA
jgi:hypothetical protein